MGYLAVVSLVVTITHYTVLGSSVDYLCEDRHDGILLPHPDDCGLFVECFHNVAFVKECGSNLHFNPKRGICDYKDKADCKIQRGHYRAPRDPYPPPKEENYRAHNEVHAPPRREQYFTKAPPHPERRYETDGPYFHREYPRRDYHTPKYSQYETKPPHQASSHNPTYVETVFGAGGNRPPYQAVRPKEVDRYEPIHKEESYQPVHDNGRYRDNDAGYDGDDPAAEAKRMVSSRMRRSSQYANKMKSVVDSMSFRYVSAFLNSKPYGKYLGLAGMYMLQAQRIVSQRYHVSRSELMSTLRHSIKKSFLHELPGVFKPDTPMPVPDSMDYCPYPKNWDCDAYNPYRSIEGTCNNLKVPIWGRSMLPFKRLLPAEYGDGIESLRTSVTGSPLPSARIVSLHLFPDHDDRDQIHTLMLMNFGQFIDHDLTHAAITKESMDDMDKGFSKEMMTEVKCGYDGCASGTEDTKACLPIPIPDEDPDFRYNRCMKFVRSMEVPTLSCTFAPREQLNQVTAWLDASVVYGSTIEESENLRDYDSRRGRLSVSQHPQGNKWKPMLPKDPSVELCRGTNATVQCFSAGDERVNEQAGLSTIHLMFVREHNRIEDNLHLMNPHWTGERLFQETRRIISAMLQHVIYNEFLPIILGPRVMKQNGLNLLRKGYYDGYDTSFDPRPANSFGAAAFRFGHTLIHETVRRTSKTFDHDDSNMLSSLFFRPGPMYDTRNGGVDSFVRGMCEAGCQKFDPFFTKQISRSLFTEDPPHNIGMDLLSLNIQRGRDHGIPSYNQFREFCGLRRAYSFDDLRYEIPNPKAIKLLKATYKTPDDIDLFAGGVSEKSVEGGIIGPTFACIIADHFKNLRKGDRFWFENGGKQAFTPDQLKELRRTMLSKIMCTNSDDVDQIQPWILYMATLTENGKDMLLKLNDVEQHEVWFETLAYNNEYDHHSNRLPSFFRDLEKTEPDLFRDMFPNDSQVPINFRVPCELLPTIDLSAWRDGPYPPHV